jgi:hypothetical protein
MLLLLLAPAQVLLAGLRLPAIIGDHMVLQQNLPNPLWGWDAPGTQVTVTFAGQTKSAQAGPDGKWTVKLDRVASASVRSRKDSEAGGFFRAPGSAAGAHYGRGRANQPLLAASMACR